MARKRKAPEITLVAQPQGFFRDLLLEALEKRRVAVQPETEFYLVNLLNQFMSTDQLYVRDQDGSAREEPLALMLKQALEIEQPRARGAMFRHIGDVSLYTAGFFQESLSRKLVDVVYYVDLGETAYLKVASLIPEQHHRRTFEELARKFGYFVDVLADVSEKTTQRSEKDLLKIYDRWIQTQSARAGRTLEAAGIPASGQKKGPVIKKGLR